MERYINIDDAIRVAIRECVKVVGHGITQFDAAEIAFAFEDIPTADVVPKSEVDRLTEELKTYNRVCGKLLIKDGVVVGMEVGKEVEYINRDIAKIFKQIAVNEAKREVAQEIFEEIERMCIDTFGNFNHRVFAELKKKYTEGE